MSVPEMPVMSPGPGQGAGGPTPEPELEWHLDQIRQREIQKLLHEGGWFVHGLDMISRLETAGFDRDQLAWFLPAQVFGGHSLTGAMLVGLQVFETERGTAPGIGFRLAVCSGQRVCPAHVEPPRAEGCGWESWAELHKVVVE
jgi:hypothetical protein